MNIIFWLAMLGMLFIAIGILILPLIRVKPTASIAYKESNLALYNSKVQELQVDLDEGRIDREHYLAAINELDHELLLDVPEESRKTAAVHYGTRAKRRPVVAMVVAIFLPAVAMLVYMQLGMHASVDPDADKQIAAEQVAQQEQLASINQMVQKLADKLDKDGGDAEAWAMLGRSYKHLQRYAEASSAFAKAIEMEPSSRLYLESAEAIALLNGKSFVGDARDLVMKALEMAPNDMNALWFAGVAEFQSGNYKESIDLLIQLSAEAKNDPEIDQSIRFYIAQAREKLIAQGKDVPSIDALLVTTESDDASPSVAGARLAVSVEIKPSVSKLFDNDTAIFVYAKAKQGPKMPLAAQRLSLRDLPTSVILDDSMAMVAGMNISAFDGVVVSARISRAGSAIAQPGDYIGSVIVDDVMNTKELKVLISNIVE